jgi:hypothetical protein
MGKYAKRLAAADQQWKDTEAGFPELPEGQYVAQVDNAEIFEPNSGGLMARINLVVAGGEHHGEKTSLIFWLEHEEDKKVQTGMRRLKDTFQRMEREVPESFSGVEDALALLSKENPLLLLQAKEGSKGGHVFVNVMGVATADDVGEMPAEAEAPAEAPENAASEEGTGEPESGEVAEGARVQFDNEGTTYTGTVESIADGVARITMEDGSDPWEGVPLEVLQVVAEEGEPEADPELADLLALAQAHEVEVDDSMGIAEVVTALKAKKLKAAELVEDEKALLAKHKVALAAALAPAPKKAAPAPARKPAPAPAKKAALAPAKKSAAPVRGKK